MRILVIDDDDDVLEALGAFLRHDGHTVEVASSAEDAIARSRPDAIVLVAIPASTRKLDLVRQIEAAFGGLPIFIVGDERHLAIDGIDGIVVAPRELHDLLRGSSPEHVLN